MNKFTIFIAFSMLILLLINGVTETCIAQQQRKVIGLVLDSSTNEPIDGAIAVLRGNYWDDVIKAFTNESGIFMCSVRVGQPYTIYIYSSRQEKPYVPVYLITGEIREDLSVTIKLVRGAIVKIEGEFFDIDMDYPAQYIAISVQVTSGLFLSSSPSGGNITKYGNYPLDVSARNQILNWSTNLVYVPSDSNITLIINGVWRVATEKGVSTVIRTVNMEIPPLTFGSAIIKDLSRETLLRSLSESRNRIDLASSILNEAQVRGFYLEMEKSDLSKCNDLLKIAERDVDAGRYLSAFSYIKQIKFLSERVKTTIEEFYAEASSSMPFMIALTTLFSVCLSYFIAEKRSVKISLFATIYVILLLSLYFSYPGFKLYPYELTLLSILVSTLIILSLAEFAPKLIREKPSPRGVATMSAIISSFSMAKRNMHRRRFQTILCIVSTLIMVFAIVVLTSYSSVEGVIITEQPFQPRYKGLLIRNIGRVIVGQSTYKMPVAIPSEIGMMAKSEENVKNVYVRYSSILADTILGELISEYGLRKPVYGILALSEDEYKHIGLSELISGSPPKNRGEIVISSSLASELSVTVNSKVYFRGSEYKVVGIIDADGLLEFRDIDNRVILPSKVYTYVTMEGEIITSLSPVRSDEVIFVSLNDVDKFDLRIISVIIDADEKLFREISAKFGYLGFSSWYTFISKVYLAEFGSMLEIKGGTSAVVPMTIVLLNIFLSFTSLVYARKKEVMALSSIGANPTHISIVFLAEAIIIGLIASGVGYPLSLAGYRILGMMEVGLQVKQKVSALWGVISIATSILVASLGGLYPAYRSAFIIVPSMLRRFRLESEARRGEYEVQIPSKIKRDLIDNFINFSEEWLSRESKGAVVISDIISTETEEINGEKIRRLIFRYEYPDGMVRACTFNELVLTLPKNEEFWQIKLKCSPITFSIQSDAVYATTRLVRRMILEWSGGAPQTESKFPSEN